MSQDMRDRDRYFLHGLVIGIALGVALSTIATAFFVVRYLPQ